jgi:hypothetical protein
MTPLLPMGLALGTILSILALPGAWHGIGTAYRLPISVGSLGVFALGVFTLGVGVVACRFRAGGSAAEGWPAGLRLAREEGWFSERPLWFMAVLVLLPAFFWAFAAWKTTIGPFTWDPAVAQWDVALHGTAPHRLWPHSPAAIRTMIPVYFTWNYLLAAVILWQSWGGTRETRTRFWTAFLLMWIVLGIGLAHLVPSAGPVFYARVTGTPGRYADLLANLAAADARYGLPFRDVHAYLWDAIQRGKVVVGGGISAFPSLHIAFPTLVSCAAWRVSRWLALALFLYAITLLVCAVGLGWHYAVDGYASLMLVPALWWMSGRLTPSTAEARAASVAGLRGDPQPQPGAPRATPSLR